jgi:hypothetical protein
MSLSMKSFGSCKPEQHDARLCDGAARSTLFFVKKREKRHWDETLLQ